MGIIARKSRLSGFNSDGVLIGPNNVMKLSRVSALGLPMHSQNMLSCLEEHDDGSSSKGSRP